ncbi:MAG: hypothetical protein EXR62_03045 [Chloroflexi bacterium]|nr:hypothetical protein [Chloroflexota bacterium]
MKTTPEDIIDLAKMAIELGQFSRAREYIASAQDLDPAAPSYEELWQQMASSRVSSESISQSKAPMFPREKMIRDIGDLSSQLNVLETNIDKLNHYSHIAVRIIAAIGVLILFQSLLSYLFRMESMEYSLKWCGGGICVILIAVVFSHLFAWRARSLQKSIEALQKQYWRTKWDYEQIINRG